MPNPTSVKQPTQSCAPSLSRGRNVPGQGLRTQAVMATGSGKTLVALRNAEELSAGRALVLVPSLDLLA